MDLTTAEEIVASDYAHDEASSDLPTAAHVVLTELDRLRDRIASLASRCNVEDEDFALRGMEGAAVVSTRHIRHLLSGGAVETPQV